MLLRKLLDSKFSFWKVLCYSLIPLRIVQFSRAPSDSRIKTSFEAIAQNCFGLGCARDEPDSSLVSMSSCDSEPGWLSFSSLLKFGGWGEGSSVLKFQDPSGRQGLLLTGSCQFTRQFSMRMAGGHMSSFHKSLQIRRCWELGNDRPGGALFILSCKSARFFAKCNWRCVSSPSWAYCTTPRHCFLLLRRERKREKERSWV